MMLKSALVGSLFASAYAVVDEPVSVDKEIIRRPKHIREENVQNCLDMPKSAFRVSPKNLWPTETEQLEYWIDSGKPRVLYLKCRSASIPNKNRDPKYNCYHVPDKFSYWIKTSADKEPKCDGGDGKKTIFEDKFDTLDFSVWQHEITLGGGGNWEFQYYANNRSNSYVHDNTLFLKPTMLADTTGEAFLSSGNLRIWGGADADYCTNNDHWGCERQGTHSNYLNPIVSARIRTMKSFSFKYGSVSFEAKLPKGDWLWPAVWLLPKYNAYSGWPSSGEIDILEARGNAEYTCGGNRLDRTCISSALHWGPRYEYNRYEMTTGARCMENLDGEDYSTDFHHFELEWTAESIKTMVDGETVMNVAPAGTMWEFGNFPEGLGNPWKWGEKMAPFDQEYYFVINLAVGGTGGFFPDGCTNAGGDKPWQNGSPTAPKDFWLAKDSQWLSTWGEGDDSAFQIRNLVVKQ